MRIFFDANICLDLLDTQRLTSKTSIDWYMSQKDIKENIFLYSADFITTIFYVLTEKRKHSTSNVITVIDALSTEVLPYYLEHSDYMNAKEAFITQNIDDFEDLMVLSSSLRAKCDLFLTNDRKLLSLKEFNGMKIEKP